MKRLSLAKPAVETCFTGTAFSTIEAAAFKRGITPERLVAEAVCSYVCGELYEQGPDENPCMELIFGLRDRKHVPEHRTNVIGFVRPRPKGVRGRKSVAEQKREIADYASRNGLRLVRVAGESEGGDRVA